MIKTVAKFSVEFIQILDEKGNVDKKLEPKLSKDELKALYRWMVFERVFDNTALSLQREGRIGTYAQSLGEEAVHVGSTFACGEDDIVFPDYREHVSFFMKGVPVKNVLLYFGGSEEGMNVPPSSQIFPYCVPVGTQTLHGAGAAIGMKLQRKKVATLTFVGDASTSTGDFHEGLNFASTFVAPAVFVIRNNQFAISIPRTCDQPDWGGCQTRAETLAQKAIGYGMEGVQVDGNDVLAVYSVVKKAIEKAKAGKGPTLIECLTYRLASHTTADDPTRYRSDKEVKLWEKKEPLVRFKEYLKKKKVWDDRFEQTVQSEVKKLVDLGVKEYEKVKGKRDDVFDYVFEKATPHLEDQKNG